MKRNRNGMFSWDPFSEITQLQKQMNQFVESVFGRPGNGQTPMQMGGFLPAADVYENGGVLKLRVEIPGVEPNDINVTLDNSVLTVKGERKIPEGENADHYLVVESPYGPFSRSFALPNTVDPSSLDAKYVNGVLEIAMSKCADAQPKQIPIGTTAKALADGNNVPATQSA